VKGPVDWLSVWTFVQITRQLQRVTVDSFRDYV
jgi:hypothetical protein